MGFSLDDALGIHPQALMLRSRRAEVLANNIANADTPNYKARDIDFQSVLNDVGGAASGKVALATTHAGHIMPARFASDTSEEMLYRVPLQPSLDGNTVDAQVEQAKFSENAMQYLASLNFLNGSLQGLLIAIRGE